MRKSAEIVRKRSTLFAALCNLAQVRTISRLSIYSQRDEQLLHTARQVSSFVLSSARYRHVGYVFTVSSVDSKNSMLTQSDILAQFMNKMIAWNFVLLVGHSIVNATDCHHTPTKPDITVVNSTHI